MIQSDEQTCCGLRACDEGCTSLRQVNFHGSGTHESCIDDISVGGGSHAFCIAGCSGPLVIGIEMCRARRVPSPLLPRSVNRMDPVPNWDVSTLRFRSPDFHMILGDVFGSNAAR